ncbi:hypothetical protein [Streptomyces sp. NPDC006267]|uniref:hypothetical protein n=1 Tax=Streptomyces sp. NPDC006267 TaxID=3157173 RepID=UPI0033A98717
MNHSTYFAYGFQIPDTDPDVLEGTALGKGVRYLQAGDYEQDRTFLVTQCTKVRLGDHRKVKPESFQVTETETWNAALTEAAARLGVYTGFEPGWIVVTDLS